MTSSNGDVDLIDDGAGETRVAVDDVTMKEAQPSEPVRTMQSCSLRKFENLIFP